MSTVLVYKWGGICSSRQGW